MEGRLHGLAARAAAATRRAYSALHACQALRLRSTREAMTPLRAVCEGFGQKPRCGIPRVPALTRGATSEPPGTVEGEWKVEGERGATGREANALGQRLQLLAAARAHLVHVRTGASATDPLDRCTRNL